MVLLLLLLSWFFSPSPCSCIDFSSSFSPSSSFLFLLLFLQGPKRGAKSVGENDDHYSNPLELFSTQGVHGGLWRTGYSLNSTDVASVLLYIFTNYHYIVFPLLLFVLTSFCWLSGFILPSIMNEWDPLMAAFTWLYAYI